MKDMIDCSKVDLGEMKSLFQAIFFDKLAMMLLITKSSVLMMVWSGMMLFLLMTSPGS